jgi:hypothetical protein
MIQAELDAGAFHAYGLSQEEVEFVINDFYKVGNPRMMTESYFQEILEKDNPFQNKYQYV